jgi:undecaprenyl pyrophosphate phosphatase UppP
MDLTEWDKSEVEKISKEKYQNLFNISWLIAIFFLIAIVVFEIWPKDTHGMIWIRNSMIIGFMVSIIGGLFQVAKLKKLIRKLHTHIQQLEGKEKTEQKLSVEP